MHDDVTTLVSDVVGGAAGDWDFAGEIPAGVLGRLAAEGVLCAQLATDYGGLGLSSLAAGRLAAHTGALCSSLRSVMTSHGMAAWTIERLGSAHQRARFLPGLVTGRLFAVAFSEPGAGTDLGAMQARITVAEDEITIEGTKTWITAAAYADSVVVFGRTGTGSAAAAIVPVGTPGVEVVKVAEPLGCRAAGHATVSLRGVRVPADHLLRRTSEDIALLTAMPLTYGRVSVAWGCVGILRACLTVATRHARSRHQGGRPLIEHQLVAQHIAQLYTAERSATFACEQASRSWDESSPDVVTAAVLAKQIAATQATRGSAAALQVLASAAAQDGHVVARAYRDAKLMEIIEGSTEICDLILAGHAAQSIA